MMMMMMMMIYIYTISFKSTKRLKRNNRNEVLNAWLINIHRKLYKKSFTCRVKNIININKNQQIQSIINLFHQVHKVIFLDNNDIDI